jgi:putative acetyltransferase
MAERIIKRTTSNDKDFQWLITQLDSELWVELKEDQVTYDQYNKVPDLNTVVVIYINDLPVASGCFKKYNADTVEVKRMFVIKEQRGKGLSKNILAELEDWAVESGFKYAILETSIHFIPATTLYKTAGYTAIPNYDQYKDLEESVCMKKELTASQFRNLKNIEL